MKRFIEMLRSENEKKECVERFFLHFSACSSSSCLRQSSYPRLLRPMQQAFICLPLTEVTLHAGHKILIKANSNILVMVIDGSVQGILDEQLRPHPFNLLNNTVIILINFIKLYIKNCFFQLRTNPLEGRNGLLLISLSFLSAQAT